MTEMTGIIDVPHPAEGAENEKMESKTGFQYLTACTKQFRY